MRLVVAASFFFCTVAFAEPTFIQKLDGLAAQCSIDGRGKYTSAQLALRDHGEGSHQYKQLLDQAYKAAKGCVEENLPKGKAELKSEVARTPHLRERLADTYAAWMGYMDWLSTPHDWGDESPQKDIYEATRNRLQAEIDIQ